MPNIQDDTFVCCKCGSTENVFYKSNSSLYKNGKLPICKPCISDLYSEYVATYRDSREAMIRLCMQFDIYFSDDLYKKSDSPKGIDVGRYLRQTNMSQFRGRTFAESIKERVIVISTEDYSFEADEEEPDISPKDIEKWGDGFDKADYDVLNSHYNLLKNANPNCDSNQEIFIGDLCYTKMQQMKAVREGRVDDYNKLTESYRKSFQQAGLKTVRDPSASEDFSFGVNAETIEKYTPAEYYKGKELYKDFDNIGGYIERFLLRPLKNIVGGTSDRDYEFYVKEDNGDSDEFTEEP